MRGNKSNQGRAGRWREISIHASTWEATLLFPLHMLDTAISIHASTWEATCGSSGSVRLCYFNSRLYMRGNPMSISQAALGILFQFTPLHERQHLYQRYLKTDIYFNSRLYMRGNLSIPHTIALRIQFQFTPLHERQQRDGFSFS